MSAEIIPYRPRKAVTVIRVDANATGDVVLAAVQALAACTIGEAR